MSGGLKGVGSEDGDRDNRKWYQNVVYLRRDVIREQVFNKLNYKH